MVATRNVFGSLECGANLQAWRIPCLRLNLPVTAITPWGALPPEELTDAADPLLPPAFVVLPQSADRPLRVRHRFPAASHRSFQCSRPRGARGVMAPVQVPGHPRSHAPAGVGGIECHHRIPGPLPWRWALPAAR